VIEFHKKNNNTNNIHKNKVDLYFIKTLEKKVILLTSWFGGTRISKYPIFKQIVENLLVMCLFIKSLFFTRKDGRNICLYAKISVNPLHNH